MGTAISDADPTGDIASGTPTFAMKGKNVGDLLNAKGLTWGWFEGGFTNPAQTHIGADGNPKADYIPHHEPFQYYPQTANPKHNPPTPGVVIGAADPTGANHQYDITFFWQALDAHNLPAVSYLKAPAYQDGHAGYSSPVFEQPFLVETINRLMKSPYWDHLAIIIAYDDSDGWYDHQMSPIVNQSQTTMDALTAPGQCGSSANTALAGVNVEHAQGRCGYGPRLPFLVISPYAKQNYVDHTTTDQSSITRFIEDNWLGGQRITGSFDALAGTLNGMFDFKSPSNGGEYLLDPSTGLVTSESNSNWW